MINSRRLGDDTAYFILGTRHFALARFAASIFLMPVAAHLYHHAFQLLLSAFVSKRGLSPDFRPGSIQNLADLWGIFKRETNDQHLDRYDLLISKLEPFDDIRYPAALVHKATSVGVSINGITIPTMPDALRADQPPYTLVIEEIDELALLIFREASTYASVYFERIDERLKKELPAAFLSEQT